MHKKTFESIDFIKSIKKSYQDWQERRYQKRVREYFQPQIDKMLEYVNQPNFVYTQLLGKAERIDSVRGYVYKETIPRIDIRVEDNSVYVSLHLTNGQYVNKSMSIETTDGDPFLVALVLRATLDEVLEKAKRINTSEDLERTQRELKKIEL